MYKYFSSWIKSVLHATICIPYRGKKCLGKEINFFCKWLNFSLTFFFPTSIFPQFFFTWQRIYRDFFSIIIINIIISYLFAKFIITMFFLCALFIVVERRNFNKNFEMQVKVKLVGKKWWIWKISQGKVTNFSELTKFFPNENFPR